MLMMGLPEITPVTTNTPDILAGTEGHVDKYSASCNIPW